LIKEIAELEQALIYFSVDALEKNGFTLYTLFQICFIPGWLKIVVWTLKVKEHR